MTVHRTLFIAICLTGSVSVSAGAGEARDAAGVIVDAVQVGVTNPGEQGVSRMVTVGEHQLSAISNRGTQWGPFPTTVSAAGRLERLGCMPADGL